MLAQPGKRVGVLGLSFKAGTDDLRESPVVQLVEALLGKGYEVRIFDGNVNLARLLGTNREYIESVVPHLADLMVDDARGLLDCSETIVVGNDGPDFAGLSPRSNGAAVVDLVALRLSDEQLRVARRALPRDLLVRALLVISQLFAPEMGALPNRLAPLTRHLAAHGHRGLRRHRDAELPEGRGLPRLPRQAVRQRGAGGCDRAAEVVLHRRRGTSRSERSC